MLSSLNCTYQLFVAFYFYKSSSFCCCCMVWSSLCWLLRAPGLLQMLSEWRSSFTRLWKVTPFLGIILEIVLAYYNVHMEGVGPVTFELIIIILRSCLNTPDVYSQKVSGINYNNLISFLHIVSYFLQTSFEFHDYLIDKQQLDRRSHIHFVDIVQLNLMSLQMQQSILDVIVSNVIIRMFKSFHYYILPSDENQSSSIENESLIVVFS